MRHVGEVIRRLWYLLNRGTFERALGEELAFHREMMERAGRSGLGSTLRLREEARDAWGWLWWDNFWRDLKYGVRVLGKSPGFTAAAVAVLSLGIGGTTAMFSIVYAKLLKPLAFGDPGRLVLGRATFDHRLNPVASAPDYYDYREQSNCFDGLSAVLAGEMKVTVTGRAEPQRAALTIVADDLFGTLGVRPVAGRWFTPEEGRPGGPPVVVIGRPFAERTFGAAGKAVGSSVAVDGRTFTIVGVAPARFRFLRDVDIWQPMRRGEGVAGIGRQFHNWLMVGRLKAGASLAAAQRQVDVISARLERQYPDSNKGKALQLDPLQSALAEDYARRLLVLLGAVGMVLLVACANVAGLLLARGSVRQPELAMRAALGASRARIVGQLLVENVALTLVAGVLGAAFAFWLSRLVPVAIGLAADEPPAADLIWPVALSALALSVVTGLLCAAAPAVRASLEVGGAGLAPTARNTGTKRGLSVRSVLVAGQVAVSVVLLTGAGLLIRSFARLSTVELGFQPQHLLTGELSLPEAQYALPGQRVRFFENLRGDFAAIPGVQAAGFISSLPIRNPSFNLAVWDTAHPPASAADQPMSFRRVVMPGYFEAAHIPLRAGRDFGRGDRWGAPLTMVINERMARTLFPGRNPIGQRVSVDMFGQQPAFEVVGVVGDVRVNSVGDSAPMTMYLSHYQMPDATMRFAIRTGQDPESITQTVRRLVLARDATIAIENVVPMEQIVTESLAPQKTTTVLLALLASIALLLAAVGLYGALAYSVAQRTREIGIRMALGAGTGSVLRTVMRQGAVLTAIGMAIGLAGAAGLTGLLRSLLYEVPAGDPLTFCAVAPVFLGVALLASYLPASRAARVDPMQALRSE
jgi:putative ABC transport system permease protein